MQDDLTAVEAADALIVGTPVYRASFTGLFNTTCKFDDVSVDPTIFEGSNVTLFINLLNVNTSKALDSPDTSVDSLYTNFVSALYTLALTSIIPSIVYPVFVNFIFLIIPTLEGSNVISPIGSDPYVLVVNLISKLHDKSG